MSKELELLRDFWNPVVKQIVGNLNSMHDTKGHNRNASGVTGQEIGAKNVDIAFETIEAYIIELTFPSYSLFIDEGVAGYENSAKTTGRFSFKRGGKRIPLSAMRSFMRSPGREEVAVPRNSEGKRTKMIDPEKELNQIAFALGAKIKREGVDMVPFISSVINTQLIEKYKKFLAAIVGARIKEEIILNFNLDSQKV